MECSEIRDGLVRGAVPPGAEAHAEVCDLCRELLADHATVGNALASGAKAAGAVDDTLWQAVHAGVAQDTGPLAWLRSRQTHHRVAIVALVGIVVASAMLVISGQSPIAGGVTVVIARLLYGGLAVASMAGGLRSLSRGPRPAIRGPAMIGAAALVPLAIAFLPTSGSMHDPGIAGAAKCFAVGLLLAIPSLLAARLADRGGGARSISLVLIAAGAGLAGLIALETECAVRAPMHLLMGHATIVLAYLAAAAVARTLARRAG